MSSSEVDTTPAKPQTRRLAIWIPATAVTAVVLLALGWWLVRPDALEPVGVGVRLDVVEDEPRLTSYVVANRRPIEIESVRPADQPPEGASISFVACRWRDPLQAFATDSGSVTDHCAETRDVEGLVLEPRVSRSTGDGGSRATREWDVLAVIELGDQPVYATDGFVVAYRDGVRRGLQTTGADVTVYSPGHKPDSF